VVFFRASTNWRSGPEPAESGSEEAAAELAAAVAEDETHSDLGISTSVRITLLEKFGSDSLHVSLDTQDGNVQLAGTVAKRETRELAEEVVKSVEGVKSLKNDIRLKSEVEGSGAVETTAKEAESETSDALPEARVHMRLLEHMGTDALKVHVEVASSVVTLRFDESLAKADRKEAKKLAQGTESVKKVIVLEK
jgi:hyperosmotically inducible periplasmic protein